MITKSTLKLIKSLQRKKNREEHQLFIVEGYKSIRELINSGLIARNILITQGNSQLDDYDPDVISNKDMETISALKTSPGYLAVFKMPEKNEFPTSGKVIALDDVKDPGNLGTIIRLADWFGIEDVVCSEETVDVYNSKCVQASMASIARVRVHYTDLKLFIEESSLPVYPTAMNGTSIYKTILPDNGILILGNESHGIRPELLKKGISVSIPQYGSTQNTESLNVAMATSVILSEWLRSTEM